MKQYDYKLSFLRTFALWCVITLHMLQSVQINTDGFPYMCGVPLFLIISAYILGQGKVSNVIEWFRKRFVRIWIPYLILLIVNICIYISHGAVPGTISVVKLLLLLPSAPLMDFHIGHCWYLSYILICYLLVTLLHKLLSKQIIIRGCLVAIVAAILCQLTAYVPFFGKLSAPHIVLYIIAFVVGKLAVEKNKSISLCIAIGVGVVVALVSRIGCFYITNTTLSSFLDLCYANFFSLGLFGVVMMLGGDKSIHQYQRKCRQIHTLV